MSSGTDTQHWTKKKSTSPDGQGTYKPIAPAGEVNPGYPELVREAWSPLRFSGNGTRNPRRRQPSTQTRFQHPIWPPARFRPPMRHPWVSSPPLRPRSLLQAPSPRPHSHQRTNRCPTARKRSARSRVACPSPGRIQGSHGSSAPKKTGVFLLSRRRLHSGTRRVAWHPSK